jgi:hypothetical protein
MPNPTIIDVKYVERNVFSGKEVGRRIPDLRCSCELEREKEKLLSKKEREAREDKETLQSI